MKKKIIIVHGWGGSPDEGWTGWLRDELVKKGHDAVTPEMPDTFYPKINRWTETINQIVGVDFADTILVGHSIGTQTILRYLEKMPPNQKIDGVVLVAAWIHLLPASFDETYTKETAREWLDTPFDFEKIKSHCDKFIVIQSDNDPDVPYSDAKIFEEKLGAEIITMNNAGHMTSDDGFDTLPVAYETIINMTKK